MYRRWPLAALVVALTAMTAPAAFGASSDPPAAAGWHGREIRDPLPQRVGDAVARFPRGWSAGSVGPGSGYVRPDGSRRVREVQRRLLRRGYRPGRIDGRFGTRTRAAVLWFQTKHGLPRTGRVDARSVATLRHTANAGRAPTSQNAPIPASAAAQEALAVAPPSRPASLEPADQGWLVLLGLTIVLGLTMIVWWLRAERHAPARPAPIPHRPPHARLTAVTPFPGPPPVDVIGYIAVARGQDRQRELDTGAQIIGSWCQSRGWKLSQLVHDRQPTSPRIAERPGLAHALEQIAAGHAAGLVLAHLGDLTHSVTELAQLLQWLNEAEAFMIALDYELDTSTEAGELAAGALIEIGDWQHGRIARRTQPGLTAMHTPVTNAKRASVRDHPQLSERINAMRAQGMSLQAISDTLNAERVPTLRGGTHWRPSSVQAATGYKRPPTRPAGIEIPRPVRTNTGHTWDNEPT